MNNDHNNSPFATTSNEADRRSLSMLLLAAIIGIVLGSLTAADWFGSDNLPDTVAARVNDTDVQLGEYHRALRLFASEKRDPIEDHDRRLVLERMVEEELLAQHGVASGLVRSHRGVRTAAIQSILTGLLVEIEAGTRERVSKNSTPETAGTGPADGIAEDADTTEDTELRAYLGQLREIATIRWIDGDSAR